MESPRPQRPRSTRKAGKSPDKAEPPEVPAEEAGPRPKSDGRLFDDLDLAAYVEEVLSVKVDALGTNIERTLSDRLIDLIETQQRLADRVETMCGRLDGQQTSSASTDDVRAQIERLHQQVASAEERAAALQDEVYRLREERATRDAVMASLEAREQEMRERENAVRAESKQSQIDLVGVRAELASVTRQLQETRQKEDAARADGVRAREELATARAERAAQRQAEELLEGSAATLRNELSALRASEERLRHEVANLRAALGRAQGGAPVSAVELADTERLQRKIDRLQADLAEARRTPTAIDSAGAEQVQRAENERSRLERERNDLQTSMDDAAAQRDEAVRVADALRADVAALREQLQAKQHDHEDLLSQLTALRTAHDAGEARAEAMADRSSALDNEPRVLAAEARASEAEDRLTRVEAELRAEIETLTARKNALTETLRAYSDPDTFRDVKLRDMNQRIESLQATMREKDHLLSESGKEQLLLGQELEKVRKEKYENQVHYERRIKELQESLQREVREKDREREGRHMLEEKLAQKKKWPLW